LVPFAGGPADERRAKGVEPGLDILGFVIPAVIVTLLLASWAHLANHRQGLAVALFAVMALGSLMLIGGGILIWLFADAVMDAADEEIFDATFGLFLAGTGFAAGVPLLPWVRSFLARLIPIDSESMPDMLGLSIMGAVGVFMVWSIQLDALEGEVSPVGTLELVMQAILLLAIAYFGVGGAITRDLSSVRERLGLHMPTAKQVALSLMLVLPIVLVSAGAAALTEWLQPDFLERIDDVMGDVTRDLTNVQGALAIGLSAGIGEEVLFRGAIQPRFGILISSALFTIIHVQYGFSFVLLGVFLTSIILGLQRKWMNTTCCIITHAAYNFLIVMIQSAAT
jgi:uncharacterized protein